jgi:hypothetical protein
MTNINLSSTTSESALMIRAFGSSGSADMRTENVKEIDFPSSAAVALDER